MLCALCGKVIVTGYPYYPYYFYRGRKIEISPGFKSPENPPVCRLCHAKHIEDYLDKKKDILKGFVEISDGEVRVKMEEFWKKYNRPLRRQDKTDDEKGWNIERFLCAIGVLTEQKEGWGLLIGTSKIELIDHTYLFKDEDMARKYVKGLNEVSHINYGVCYVSNFILPSDL